MNIRIINIAVYVVLIMLILYCFCIKHKDENKWVGFVQNHLSVIIVLLIFNTISFAVGMNGVKTDYYIERQPVDGSEKQYSFEAEINGESIPFSIEVPPKRLKPKEVEKLMDDAFSYIDAHLKGENASLDKVESNLDISFDHEKYPFDEEVIPNDYTMISEDGILRNDAEQLRECGYTDREVSEGILTGVKIKLSYGDVEKEKTYSLVVFPKEPGAVEKTVSEIEKMYRRKEQESIYENGFNLPANYKGIDVICNDQKGISPEGVLLIGILIAGLLVLKEVESKHTENVNRNRELLQAYPWFVNELVLLSGAGMQVRNVFALLVNEYDGEDYRKVLVDELNRSKHDFEIGMAEEKVYYELGRRLKLPCYIKLLTMLEQNVTKGSRGIAASLEQEERNALEERMNMAKKRGEEAGTKLLGPMGILLIIVMLMIMVPAFMSLR